jgi:3,4-dihydroxy 2-butanone 4-phosphate synthase/GTP cyclohydrolase II
MSITLASTEEILEEIRLGRMVILVDDEDRENEGDLIIPAGMATPEAINFMARFGRGLICLCLTEERARDLNLEPMVRTNGTRHGTAFTASINAAMSEHNPISAAGRAHTIATAIAANGPASIATPGQVFPLIARDGGVLVRTGHTEAAVDLARLAGLYPSAVICEIMKDDGEMARLDDLVVFAQEHGLKLGTIRDLILYRRRHDQLVERVWSREIDTDETGKWQAIVYRNRVDDSETLALVKGVIDPATPTLVRMHVPDALADMIHAKTPRKGLLDASMRTIADAGEGVIVLVSPSPGKALTSFAISTDGTPVGRPEMLRDYGLGAQILADLGVHDMRLLTNTHMDLIGLAGYGLAVVEERPVT